MISIIIPVYNAEKYLDRCIISILKQSFKNWELILLNDGSTDGSGKICDKYKQFDNRIRVIHKENTGVSSTRNLGIDLSRGKYITFIDSDDWIDSNYLEMMYNAINEMNVEIIVTGCVYENKFGSNNPFKKGKPEILTKDKAQLEFLKQDKFMWSVYDKLYDKNLFNKYHFDEKLKIAEDMLLFWQLINSVEKIGYFPLYKYHYDIQASSTMSSEFSLKWFDPLKVKKYILEDIKKTSYKYYFLAKMLYVGELAGLLKKSLKTNKYNTKRLSKLLQIKIRKNMYLSFWNLNSNILTLRQRFGIIYACLPYKLCKFFIKFL